jgi:hypothetical protein
MEMKMAKSGKQKDWRETGNVHMRLKEGPKAEFIKISDEFGECGPTHIINFLLRRNRELTALQA